MDFNAILQSWKGALTNPNEEYFRDQLKLADLTQGAVGVLIAAVIAGILSGIGTLFGGAAMTQSLAPMFEEMGMSAAEAQAMFAASQPTFIGMMFATMIGSVVGFFIGAAIYWIFAKLLGGDGSYEEQTYLMSTYTAPLLIINGVLNLIPFIGPFIAIFVSIYQLVLSYFAIKVSHRLTSGRAIMVLLLPLLIIFICVCCATILFMSLAGAMVGDVFSGVSGTLP